MSSYARRLTILQVSKLYSPYIGGVEQVVQTVAEGLRESLRTRVLVCNTAAVTERTEVNGVPVIRTASHAWAYSMPLSVRFFSEFRREERTADVVNLHVPFPLGELAAVLFRRRPLVVWWHSDMVRQKRFAKAWAPITRALLGRADRIVIATPNHLRYSTTLAAFAHKCIVIPYGIDTAQFAYTGRIHTRATEIRAAHGTPLVMFVGRLAYYKGVDVLLRAMVNVRGHLVIVGEGAVGYELKALADSLNLQDRVTFVGAVPSYDLPAYFHACDVFVLPSTAPSEAFGLVQLEAMACGKPVINTQLESGAPWVSVHGETGITVPPGEPGPLAEAITALLSDASLRTRYGENGLARVRRYCDIHVMLESVRQLYESVA